MVFERLVLKNFRCFKDAEIRFSKRATVVLGVNASGKTSLLEAIASLTHGDDEGLPDFPLRHGAKSGEIVLYEEGKRSPAASWSSKAKSRKRLPSDAFVFLYGRYRRVPGETRKLSDSDWLQELAAHPHLARTTTLTRPDNRLMQDVSGYIRGMNFGRIGDPGLEKLWSQLNEALPKLDPSLEGIRMEGSGPFVIRNGIPLDLAQLSDGYQAVLVIILDLMMRFAYLFFGDQPKQALVGVDEIDLHLHPGWQRTILSQLTELFPETQLLLTTHSPGVVQSAIDEGLEVVRLLESSDGVTIEPLPAKLRSSLRGAEVGSVLHEKNLFQVESPYSPYFDATVAEMTALQEKVREGAATKTDHRKLLSHLEELEGLVAKEDRRRANGSIMAHLVRMQAEFVKALSEELEKTRK